MTHRDVRLMRDIAASASTPVGDANDPMPSSVLTGLFELIRCDNVSFIGFAQDRREMRFDQEVGDPGPTGDTLDGWVESFWEHYWHYPPFFVPELVNDFADIVTMSDYLSRRRMRSSGMYGACLRPIEVEYVLTVCLPHQWGHTLRVNFYRASGPDFSQRDRDVLSILRPHIDGAYRAQCERRHPTPTLTPRETEVMSRVAAGRTNRQIGRELSISEATVRKHLEHIFGRLGVASRTEAVTRLTRPSSG